jgi:hypothetical protein
LADSAFQLSDLLVPFGNPLESPLVHCPLTLRFKALLVGLRLPGIDFFSEPLDFATQGNHFGENGRQKRGISRDSRQVGRWQQPPACFV